MAWLVWRLEHNAFLLGLAGFAGRIPAFFLTPLAGVLVDRWSRHRLVILTQVPSMIQALVMAGLMFSGHITVWQIILLSLLLGFIDALALPARQAFIVQLVDRREDLAGAIALNSSMVNGARMLGPMIAGVVIAASGEGICFLLNGLSYIPGIATLLMMTVSPHRRAATARGSRWKPSPPPQARPWRRHPCARSRSSTGPLRPTCRRRIPCRSSN